MLNTSALSLTRCASGRRAVAGAGTQAAAEETAGLASSVRHRQRLLLCPEGDDIRGVGRALSRTSRTPNDSDGHPCSPKQPSARNLFCLYLAPADWSNCRE